MGKRRPRRAQERALTKEAVRGTAWAVGPDSKTIIEVEAEPGAGVLVPCPQCGGRLVPVEGWQRVLDPKLVCTECRMLWADTEAIAGRWASRKFGVRDPHRHRLSALELQRNWMLGAAFFGGVLVVLLMAVGWIRAEQGHCGACDFRDLLRSDEVAQESAQRSRVIVPAYVVGWLTLVGAFLRSKENTTGLAPGFLGWIAVSMVALVAL